MPCFGTARDQSTRACGLRKKLWINLRCRGIDRVKKEGRTVLCRTERGSHGFENVECFDEHGWFTASLGPMKYMSHLLDDARCFFLGLFTSILPQAWIGDPCCLCTRCLSPNSATIRKCTRYIITCGEPCHLFCEELRKFVLVLTFAQRLCTSRSGLKVKIT